MLLGVELHTLNVRIRVCRAQSGDLSSGCKVMLWIQVCLMAMVCHTDYVQWSVKPISLFLMGCSGGQPCCPYRRGDMQQVWLYWNYWMQCIPRRICWWILTLTGLIGRHKIQNFVNEVPLQLQNSVNEVPLLYPFQYCKAEQTQTILHLNHKWGQSKVEGLKLRIMKCLPNYKTYTYIIQM